LKNLALEKGSTDNISVMVLKLWNSFFFVFYTSFII
jgi:hypothetical protein